MLPDEQNAAVWPLREVISAINRSESPLLLKQNQVFWRDLYDHAVQVMDMVENARESLASMHDTYLSSLSNRMNEVMKMLTIISTIFIPLTFIAGIYVLSVRRYLYNKQHIGYIGFYFLKRKSPSRNIGYFRTYPSMYWRYHYLN